MGKQVQRMMEASSASLFMGELFCNKKDNKASVTNTYAHSPIWTTMKEMSALVFRIRVA